MAHDHNAKNKVFIDADLKIYEGEEAAKRIEDRNLQTHIDGDRGIVSVDAARWKEAQTFERKTWMESLGKVSDDRNWNHRRSFDNYRIVSGRRFSRAIELGCGPFTNMRLILQSADADEVFLLDPLASDYLNHPYCRYRGKKLGGLLRADLLKVLFAGRNPLRALRELAGNAKVGGLFGRDVEVIPSSIEAFDTDQKFDLAVMINVLEHCMDAEKVFNKILSLLAPGGVFIFHDKLYDDTFIAQTSKQIYDVGHPLRVTGKMIEGFLGSNFRTLHRKKFEDRSSFHGVEWTTQYLYFIGDKIQS